jgi:hypothetical protein
MIEVRGSAFGGTGGTPATSFFESLFLVPGDITARIDH